MMTASCNLIPQDPLTRKLLAKVLAEMIRDDFLRLRGNRYGRWIWKLNRTEAGRWLVGEILDASFWGYQQRLLSDRAKTSTTEAQSQRT